MRLVYSNENSTLVSHAKNILENEGIELLIKNEHGSADMHSAFIYQEIWAMRDGDFDKAKNALSKLESSSSNEDWICTKCNETNDSSFETCWKCANEST